MTTVFVPCGQNVPQQLSMLYNAVHPGEHGDTSPKTPHGFLAALFGDESKVLKLIQSGEANYELAFCLGFSLLPIIASKRVDEMSVDKAVSLVSKALTFGEDAPQVKLNLFKLLINSLPVKSKLRFVVYEFMVDFAISKKITESVVDSFEYSHKWAVQWGLDKLETVRLYQLVSKGFQAVGKVEKVFETLKRIIALGEGEEEPFHAKIIDDVERALVMLCLDPEIPMSDELVEFDAVKRLEASNNIAAKLYALLFSGNVDSIRIFARQNGKDFEKFVDSPEVKILEEFRVFTAQTLVLGGTCFSFDELLSLFGFSTEELEIFLVTVSTERDIAIRIDEEERLVHVLGGTFKKVPEPSEVCSQLRKLLDGLKSIL